MSEVASAAELHHGIHDGVLNGNGAIGKKTDTPADVGAGDEESDDYNSEEDADYAVEPDAEEDRQIVGDEDDSGEEEEEEEGEAENQDENTLTHLLLGDPNEGGDDEDEDEEDDEDDGGEYEDAVPVHVAPPISKKRSIDEVADEDDLQGSKKIKA